MSVAFGDLPLEVSGLCFSFSSWKDLLRLSTVSKRCRYTVFYVLHRIVRSPGPGQFAFLTRSGSSSASLENVDHLSLPRTSFSSAGQLHLFRFPNLRRIELSDKYFHTDLVKALVMGSRFGSAADENDMETEPSRTEPIVIEIRSSFETTGLGRLLSPVYNSDFEDHVAFFEMLASTTKKVDIVFQRLPVTFSNLVMLLRLVQCLPTASVTVNVLFSSSQPISVHDFNAMTRCAAIKSYAIGSSLFATMSSAIDSFADALKPPTIVSEGVVAPNIPGSLAPLFRSIVALASPTQVLFLTIPSLSACRPSTVPTKFAPVLEMEPFWFQTYDSFLVRYPIVFAGMNLSPSLPSFRAAPSVRLLYAKVDTVHYKDDANRNPITFATTVATQMRALSAMIPIYERGFCLSIDDFTGRTDVLFSRDARVRFAEQLSSRLADSVDIVFENSDDAPYIARTRRYVFRATTRDGFSRVTFR